MDVLSEHPNEQEIFNTVVRHLLVQGEKSKRRNGDASSSCMYRGPNGLSCAVGCLITDEEYREEMEGDNIEGILQGGHLQKLEPFAHLLYRLQQIHDNYKPQEWERKLRGLAEIFDLSFPVINLPLEKSIAHWRRLAEGTQRAGEGIGAKDCALCEHYAYQKDDFCVKCPVQLATGERNCKDTPFPMTTLFRVDSPEFRREARKELEFLISLRETIKEEVR